MSQTSRSTTDLVQAHRAGEPQAVNQLLERYRSWLLLLARLQADTWIQRKFDASDIVQQTMLEAVRDLPKFRGSTAAEFTAWLRQILAHVLSHEIRRYRGTRKRDVAREFSIEESLDRSSMQLQSILATDESSPSHKAADCEQEVALAAVLERLPPDYRQIIVLRHLEGISHEEAARRMNRSDGAVRMLWVRALARLKKELQS